jgi:hypothetical protein
MAMQESTRAPDEGSCQGRTPAATERWSYAPTRLVTRNLLSRVEGCELSTGTRTRLWARRFTASRTAYSSMRCRSRASSSSEQLCTSRWSSSEWIRSSKVCMHAHMIDTLMAGVGGSSTNVPV